jgi:copper ion binding protein
LITSVTLIHTFATIFFLLGVLAHLAALIFKVNRPLVRSIFTGEVNLGYVQDRHTIWYDEMTKNKGEGEVKVETEVKREAKEERDGEVEVVGKSIETESIREDVKMATTLKVKGMSCQHCVMSVTKALGQLEGIKNVQVDLAKGEVRFDNTKEFAFDKIEKAVADAGYEVISS